MSPIPIPCHCDPWPVKTKATHVLTPLTPGLGADPDAPKRASSSAMPKLVADTKHLRVAKRVRWRARVPQTWGKGDEEARREGGTGEGFVRFSEGKTGWRMTSAYHDSLLMCMPSQSQSVQAWAGAALPSRRLASGWACR